MQIFNLGLDVNPIVKKNFILNLFDGAVFSFGMSFVSVVTILPIYLKQLGASNIAIGILPVVWALGFNLPQIIIANYTGNQPYKKKIIMITSLFQRIPWLLLSLLSMFCINKESSTSIILFFLCFGLAAIGGGFNLPAWFDLFSKLTPVSIRGKQFAYRTSLGALLGIIAGKISVEILDRVVFPINFSILFFIGSLIMLSSYLFLIQLIENEPNPPRKTLDIKEFILNLPTILKKEINYRNFLIADALLIIGIVSNTFIAVYAIEKFGLPESYAGVFTVVVMFSLMFGSLIFGMVADKFGHRINILISAIFIFFTCLIALISGSITSYYFVFFFSAVVTGILNVSRLPLISELCNEDNRPTFVSLGNFITIPFVLSGIFAGWFAETWGYESVFILSGIVALAASFWILFKLKEPRLKNCEIL